MWQMVISMTSPTKMLNRSGLLIRWLRHRTLDKSRIGPFMDLPLVTSVEHPMGTCLNFVIQSGVFAFGFGSFSPGFGF
jgi:hypothetical protein